MAEPEKKTDEPPVARFVAAAEREKIVPLEWPFHFGDRLIDTVRVKRVSGAEMKEFWEQMARDERFIPPVIDCSQAVWDAMDPDDQEAVDAAAEPFMPRRLKAAVKLSSGNGENTSGS